MRRFAAVLAFSMLASGGSVVTAAPCFAIGAGDNTARVVIETGDNTATFCISFEEESISGLEALRRLGLTVTAEDFGGGQVTVCQIGGVGCAYPGQSCFCECEGSGPCTFWGYYRANNAGEWEFSTAGASVSQVRDGDREGWRYGPQTPEGGNSPQAKVDSECLDSIAEARFLAVAEATSTSSPLPLFLGLAGALSVLLLLGVRAKRLGGQA